MANDEASHEMVRTTLVIIISDVKRAKGSTNLRYTLGRVAPEFGDTDVDDSTTKPIGMSPCGWKWTGGGGEGRRIDGARTWPRP